MSLLSGKGPGYVECDLAFVSVKDRQEIYFVAVEPFTRLCFVKMIPNRAENTLLDAFREMVAERKATRVRADMEFQIFSLMNWCQEKGIRIELVPVEIQDYTRLASVNRFCRSLRRYRLSGIPPDDLQTFHNEVKPDRYYPKKTTNQVSHEENVEVMNRKHVKALLPVKHRIGDVVHVRLFWDKKIEKERPKWSRASYRIFGNYHGRWALCRTDDRTGNLILRRFNEVKTNVVLHRYENDTVEKSNLYLVTKVHQCTTRLGTPITSLEAVNNSMDCWYQVELLDGRRVWVTINKLRYTGNEPSPAEEAFFGKIARFPFAVVHISAEEIGRSMRRWPG